MKKNEIEGHIRQLFADARQASYQATQYQMRSAEWEASNQNASPPDWLIEGEEEYAKPFRRLCESLYLSTVYLLDSRKLSSYLKHFYNQFGEKFDQKQADDYEVDYLWCFDPYSTYLTNLYRFLEPLGIVTSSNEYHKLTGIHYLENVLDETALVIKKSNINPTSEPMVYKAVKSLLKILFPSSKDATSKFIKTAKCYKPDILIPELGACIEYKYSKTGENVASLVDQILEDANGYTGDSDYNIFYAVFYVKKDDIGRNRFAEIWKEKRFPNNWKAFYVIESR